MSENTNYFAVKSTSAEAVQKKLNAAKILSIVDEDNDGYWFSTQYPKIFHKWIIVTAPPQIDAEVKEITIQDISDGIHETNRKIKENFETTVHFIQPGNSAEWEISIKSGKKEVEKYFSPEEETIFTEDEKNIFSQCFEKDFLEMENLLKPGLGADFLNSVGIPFMEMNDQNKVQIEAINEQYSFFSNQISD